MKQYLKMKDLFPLGVVSEAGFFNINSDGDVVVDIECISFHATTEEASNYVTHAINSHDELVQMNQELLDIIKRVIDTSKELEGKICASSWTDGYKQCAIDTGSSLSDLLDKYKQKVGAA